MSRCRLCAQLYVGPAALTGAARRAGTCAFQMRSAGADNNVMVKFCCSTSAEGWKVRLSDEVGRSR